MTVPVIIGGKIVAVSAVANRETDYTQLDVRQLTIMMDRVWRIFERITLIEDLEKAKEKAEESDRLKSAFLANMSHEIRTPMNGILGFSELLKDQGLSSDQVEEYVGIIHKSGQRLLNTINDLIDISRIEAGVVKVSREEVNVIKAMNYFYKFFKPETDRKGIELKPPGIPDLEKLLLTTDKEKFYAILTNLLKNAIKYTQKGSITFGFSVKDKNLEFYILDTGNGIPKEKQDSVFERFVQVDATLSRVYEGSGLGLSIVKAYIEMLGGEIWFESEVGKGTRFFFALPR